MHAALCQGEPCYSESSETGDVCAEATEESKHAKIAYMLSTLFIIELIAVKQVLQVHCRAHGCTDCRCMGVSSVLCIQCVCGQGGLDAV
jgi:hypothetical protein